MKNTVIILCVALLVMACSETVARRPVTQKSGSYVKTTTITRNKERVAQEEEAIKKVIKSDTVNEYLTSASGFWYSYVQKDSLSKPTPQVGDLVLFKYDIASISGKILVSQEEIGNTVTQIDQSNQELISGIREGLKLMREGETVRFLFPSHKAYGYYGVENKVPSNIPVASTVTLLEIKNQSND